MAVKDVNVVIRDDGVLIATWEAGADGDTGKPIAIARFADRTAQAIGDATSVAIQGSNDGTTFAPLNDTAGTAIALAGATDDVELIPANPIYIRPAITGGTSTVVIVAAVGAR